MKSSLPTIPASVQPWITTGVFGLITLIGLIAKNGILIVDFANRLQVTEGLDKREAVARATATRYRPILMTTVAMLMAMELSIGSANTRNIGVNCRPTDRSVRVRGN